MARGTQKLSAKELQELQEIQDSPLPEGGRIVTRAEVNPDRKTKLELAAELAQRGATDEFLEIIGGKAAVQAANRSRGNSNGASESRRRRKRTLA
jgi:hypothetical protein